MSSIKIDLSNLKIAASAEVLHRPSAVRLDGYPLLAYAPDQHGPGVRTEDNGTPVAEICSAITESPDYQAVAERFGTTADHVIQAVAYGIESGAIAIEPEE